MLTKTLSLLLVICAMYFNVRSQTTGAGGGKTIDRKSNTIAHEKFVSADDAARNALNVGAKMPAFKLKDAGGKIVESV